MTEYLVKIGFWLRPYDGFAVEANSDAEAIEKAKVAAKSAMESRVHPEHIAFEERREGIIAYIDRITLDGPEVVSENVEFDDDLIQRAAVVRAVAEGSAICEKAGPCTAKRSVNPKRETIPLRR
jgi:hypothetical protein